ncbi:autoinducer binding domain-containing protein [Marinicaulis aureus]|uniref:Autoinducer binding domain-containing protein n=1 Tax=Hyphococcus aureus TaxID=2666033 RepID=A0ABW1KUE5_9PROT
MRSNIDAFIEATLRINDVGRLKRYFEAFIADLGYNIVNYHVLVEGFKSVPLHKGFRLSTFPEGYIRYFIDHKCFEFDPIMDEARKRGGPILWSDIAARPNLTAEQQAMFAAAREYNVTTGAAFSIYGRPGEVAYFCLGSTEREVEFTRAQLLELQAICQQMHLRFHELTRDENGKRKLSKRETEVLELIAQGKSNPVISAMLGVSPNTVDTLVRRCFDKLGVTSRVEAALAGVAMGIILP